MVPVRRSIALNNVVLRRSLGQLAVYEGFSIPALGSFRARSTIDLTQYEMIAGVPRYAEALRKFRSVFDLIVIDVPLVMCPISARRSRNMWTRSSLSSKPIKLGRRWSVAAGRDRRQWRPCRRHSPEQASATHSRTRLPMALAIEQQGQLPLMRL